MCIRDSCKVVTKAEPQVLSLPDCGNLRVHGPRRDFTDVASQGVDMSRRLQIIQQSEDNATQGIAYHEASELVALDDTQRIPVPMPWWATPWGAPTPRLVSDAVDHESSVVATDARDYAVPGLSLIHI